MSRPPEDGAREALREVAARARAALRDWTDATDHDPGVALLELLALLADQLGTYADRIAAEAQLGRTEVLVGGRAWRQVADLAASGADDDHVQVTERADGSTVVGFGDGVHGRRPTSGEAVTVRYRGGAGFASVVLDAGRVTLVPAGPPPPPADVIGVHRGVVEGAVDPMTERRLLVRVPSVLGDQAVWALACLPVGADELPDVGDPVWVAFEAGDPFRPVWLGRPGRR